VPNRRTAWRRFIGIGIVLATTSYGVVATQPDRRALNHQSAEVETAASQVLESPSQGSRAPNPESPVPRVDAVELMRVARTLSSPEMQGRRTGTEGGRRARQFIQSAFSTIGLEPFGTSGYEQPFSFVRSSVKGFLLPGRPWQTRYPEAANLVGRVPGTDRQAKSLVVSAHYDHLGVINGVVYPGADDNASGIAAMLAVARYAHAHPLRHAVVFAAFDAEELDLEGSRAFVQHPPVPLSAIALNINFDMVSRNDRNEIVAAGTYHYPWLLPMLEGVRRGSAVKILFGHDRPTRNAGPPEDWTMQSDHGSFHKAGIPFVYFGVEDYADYHQPTDTADKIDPVFFANAVEMLVDAVLTLDRRLP
jgi:hypothetical protein